MQSIAAKSKRLVVKVGSSLVTNDGHGLDHQALSRWAEQIAELNQMVADFSVPKIIAEASMHKTYLHDLQNLPVPLAHPIMLTKTGSKSASFDRFF